MRKIAIYGKGGSGKSTISAALSVVLARRGMKVLHVGCDPKADSALTLTSGARIATLLDLLAAGDRRPSPDRFVFRGRHGIDCIEAGGPKPGAGCGGRGVARMFELFQEIRLLQGSAYDIVMFDVLGDVVCGGFAAPLRLGFADLAFIVVSEEPLSLYAANNIIHAVRSYSANGVRLGGFILNVSDDPSGESLVRSLAERVGTQVVGVIPRDREVQAAERRHLTAAELEPGSPTVLAFEQLADAILSSSGQDAAPLSPMSSEDLFALLADGLVPGPTASSGLPGHVPATVLEGTAEVSGIRDGAGGPDTHGARKSGSPAAASETVVAEVRAAGGAHRTLPADRTVVASAETRAAFFRLFLLDRQPISRLLFEVSEVQVRRAVLFIVLDSPASGRIELQLSGNTDKAYARVRDIAVAHSEPLPRGGGRILDYCIRCLERSGVTFADLCTRIEMDAGSSVEATSEEARDRRIRPAIPQARHWNEWTGDSLAGVFFFPQERKRQVVAEVRLCDPVTLVQHGTQACGASEQATTEYSSHFVRYPWREDRTGRESRAGAAYYLTDIREHEIIAGSNEALEGALSQVHANHPDDAVIVAVACSPVVSGEDWAGTVKRFRQVHKAPVMATAIAGDDLILEIARVGREVLDSAKAQDCEVRHDEGRAAGKADSRAADRRNAAAGGRPSDAAAQGRVHLVGFPRTRGTEELCGLLRACGVQVVQRQVPDVSLRRLSGYSGEASAQLLWPQAEYEPLYEALFLRASVPAVRVPAPFGLSGTRAFLDAAVRAAGLHVPHAVARIEAQLETAGRDLAVLAQRAAAVRLGVAVTPHFTSVPDSPELACGVPLIAFLRELGFQVEILHDAQDPARLDWWLRSRLSAVFTELSFDSRLSAAGVAPFGLPDLEPGVAGAIRTARRLLRLADMRFFRHLAPYRCEEGGQ